MQLSLSFVTHFFFSHTPVGQFYDARHWTRSWSGRRRSETGPLSFFLPGPPIERFEEISDLSMTFCCLDLDSQMFFPGVLWRSVNSPPFPESFPAVGYLAPFAIMTTVLNASYAPPERRNGGVPLRLARLPQASIDGPFDRLSIKCRGPPGSLAPLSISPFRNFGNSCSSYHGRASPQGARLALF